MAGKRQAFTLVELLVVIALILVLASLTVAFLPALSEQQRAARGAGLLQQWLITAQQQALRDRAPWGVRLYVETINGRLAATEAQYIRQPDDFSGGTLSTLGDNAIEVVLGGNVDVTNGHAEPELWAIQPGDYLEILGVGPVFRLAQPQPPLGGQVVIPLDEPGTTIPYKIEPTTTYRIIRQPRVTGDDVLRLPEEIAVDLSTNAEHGNTLNFNTFEDTSGTQVPESVDILFGPSGNVIGKQTGSDMVILWVRDITTADPREGEPTLIAVYSRTGAIAAHPVNIAGPDFYAFTKDGLSSGGTP